MNRGDVYQAVLDPVVGHEQQGTRPVVIVQCDLANRAGGVTVIVPFTSQQIGKRAALPGYSLVRAGSGGLTVDSVANCHQIRVVDQTRLRGRMGTLPPQEMAGIERALRFVLGL